MKCLKCPKKAIGAYSFDIDLPKFPFCKKHEDTVYVELLIKTTFADVFKDKKRKKKK